MTQRKLRELVKAANPVYTPARLLPQDEDVRSLFAEVMNRTGNPQASTDLLDTTVERRRVMETQEKPIRVAPIPKMPNKKRRLVAVLAGAAVVVLVAVGMSSLLFGDESDVAGPQATVEGYFAAFNSQDIEAVLEFFTEASRIDFHPKDKPVFRGFGEPLRGLTEIRRTLQREMDLTAPVDGYVISNVEVSGNSVTWDHAWTENDGGRTCAEGHSATIEDGKILFWEYPVPHSCPS